MKKRIHVYSLVGLLAYISVVAYYLGGLAARQVGADFAPATQVLGTSFVAVFGLLLLAHFCFHWSNYRFNQWAAMLDPGQQLEYRKYVGEFKGSHNGDYLFLLYPATIAPSYGLQSLSASWQARPRLVLFRSSQLDEDILSVCRKTDFQLHTAMKRGVFFWKKTDSGGILLFHPRADEITLTGRFPMSSASIDDALMQPE